MNQKASRPEVFAAIEGECDYAAKRWNESTTTSGGNHSPQEWLSYIEHYARGGIHAGCVKPDQEALPEQLDILRKIAGLAVSAMQNCGVRKRTTDTN